VGQIREWEREGGGGRGWEVVRHSGSNTRAKDEYPPLSPTERPLTPLFSEILAFYQRQGLHKLGLHDLSIFFIYKRVLRVDASYLIFFSFFFDYIRPEMIRVGRKKKDKTVYLRSNINLLNPL